MVGVKFDAESKLWSCTEEPKCLDPNECYGTFLLDILSKHGSKVAQINHDTGVRMTYDELRLKTIRAAQNLQKKGFQYKDVFAFLAVNSDDLCPIVFASFCMGCTINPLHSTLSKKEIALNLKKTNTKAIFCDVDSYNLICEALNESQLKVPIFTFDGQISTSEPVESLLIQTGNEHEFVSVHGDMLNDIAAIFSSSGTTGPSKCIAFPYSMIYLSKSIFSIKEGICLSFEPLFWSKWIYYALSCIMQGSTRIITRYSFSAALQLEIIEKHKVTFLYIIPSYMSASLKNDLVRTTDLSSVQQILVFGGKASSGIVIETYRYYPNAEIRAGYGLTEIGWNFLWVLNKNGKYSAGVLCEGVTMKIVDDHGNRCVANVDGEICTKAKYKLIEYLNDTKATAAAFDNEGFFLTGDIGHFDENGTLHITDRKKDVFKIFHFEAPFAPSEMESYLITLPDVQEVCIVCITTGTDEKLPAAVIVRNSNSTLSERGFFELVANHFPKREWLRGGVYFVDSLPKTPSGKIIRRKVAELATEIFHKRGINDPDIQAYIADIPEEYHKLIAISSKIAIAK
ncbi:4-coumarate--CoA ligase-like 7 [Contarinia nasturtii]|uniref:4-coumarate--CoA ligase-like 7 n=1 Tax=Contarinia nasturtii TaxID=265458 RepID=UPI0012D44DBB|nr:4-coumarate--CoA ligase-like 7 [Contarinia nasturtii]